MFHHRNKHGDTIRTGADLLDELAWHRTHEQSAGLYRSSDGAALSLRADSVEGRKERARRIKLARRIGKMGGAP